MLRGLSDILEVDVEKILSGDLRPNDIDRGSLKQKGSG